MSTNLKLFFQQFREDFFHMGAIMPSSGALAKAGVDYLVQKQGPVRVLEVGAGTGSFTRQIAPLLEAGDELDVVEINPDLITYLQECFKQEPDFQTSPDIKVNFICDDVRNIPSQSYHYIVFSLPLTNFSPDMVQEILDLMIERLEPGGVFSYVKYIFISRFKYLFSGADAKSRMKSNQAIIKSFADCYQIDQRAVVLNVPPTWVYYWQKKIKSGDHYA